MSELSGALRQFVDRTGIPLKKLSEISGLSSIEVMSWIAGEHLDLSYRHIEDLSHFVGITTEDFVAGKYDPSLIRKRIYDNPLILPQKYGVLAHSNIRTSAHIVDFLRLQYGQRKTDVVLSGMGVNPLLFDKLDNKINLTFFCDLLKTLKRFGDPSLSFSKLANLSPLFLKETEFIDNFAKCTSYEQLYGIIMQNIDKFDENFEYKYWISERGLLFQAHPSDFLRQLLCETDQAANINFKDLFSYRKHLLGSYPLMLNMEPLKVERRKAIYEGDLYDEYFISFPDKTKSADKSNNVRLLKVDGFPLTQF